MSTPHSSIPTVRLFGIGVDGAVPLALPVATDDVHRVLDQAPLGIYEGFRTFLHRRFLRLDRHFDRAEASLAAVGKEARFDRDHVRRSLQQACDDWPGDDCRIRLDFLNGPATALGHDGEVLFVLSALTPPPLALLSTGVKVGIAHGLTRERPLAKQAQWVLDRRAAEGPYYESLLLDPEGRVLECTSANLFAVRDGRLITAGDGVLEGITREVVLDVARELCVPIELRRPFLDELKDADEAFLTSASRSLLPIVEVESTTIGTGRPGPVWRKLREGYLKLVEREVQLAWPRRETRRESSGGR